MNFANSFLKDIKGNSSINQFGSKIKNMSQSFVPENTKDMLASAASSISNATATATAAANNTTTTGSSNMTNSSSQSNQLRPGQSSQKIANSDSQMDARYSTSGVYSQSPSTSFQQKQQQQQQPQQQRIINPSQRVTRTESNNNDQFNNNNNTRSTSLQREPSNQFVPKQQQMYSSLETMSESSPYTNTYTNNNNNNKINQIDPMELEALKETNEALKSEVQRLSLFELKSKSLEKEVFNTKKIHSNSVTKSFLICFKEKFQINHFKHTWVLKKK